MTNSAARLMREKKLLSTRTEHCWYFTSQKCIARDKPVYLNGDIRRAYIRRGGGDERCTPEEIERFLRDASDRRYDSELIEGLDAEDFFDPHTVSWYRRVFNEMNPGRHEALTDVEFLNEWGCVVESGDRLIPTRAAVLLFGQGKYVRQILPRAVVDYQRIDNDFDQWSPDKRWHDRVVVEENIIQAWRTLVERYMSQAERPFDLDAASMRRHDVPPDYISFREAAINLLIHQDYGDHTRKPVIKFFRDRDDLLESWGELCNHGSIVRPGRKGSTESCHRQRIPPHWSQ